MIVDNGVKVVSFDVFDTLITRVVANPVDVFLLMISEIARQFPFLDKDFLDSFQSKRIESERVAREQSDYDDVTIIQIYDHLSSLQYFPKELIPNFVQIELQVEKQVVAPIQYFAQYLHKLRSQGLPVILASDMYLPQDAIRILLLHAGIKVEELPLYVSGELGVSKYSGRLFENILTDLKIQPAELLHIGDNWYSDVYIPRSIGINVPSFRLLNIPFPHGFLRKAKLLGSRILQR